jgi:hypothetical protein
VPAVPVPPCARRSAPVAALIAVSRG